MTTVDAVCRACGAEPREGARFCDACGSPVGLTDQAAEYKQVTVLFADVVRSMDLASALGAERLREVMSEVFNQSAAVVHRYGGTVDKFTGDGIMALFGAPVALEDHALRACLAALDIQREVGRLAAQLGRRDGIDLTVRIGLNSGEVIAGAISSLPSSYTAVGEQVGMAQRMEAAAPPGGVMLSASTARLVEGVATLGEQQSLHIKGGHTPVPARRLLAISAHGPTARQRSTLVGRGWEMSAVAGLLEQAIAGNGCVVGVMGPPGIGKSRIVAEATELAAGRGIEVFTTYCDSHASDVPFYVVAHLARKVLGVADSDDESARRRIRTRFADDNPEDVLLLEDMLGIRDSAAALPDVAPDARRRRLTQLVNTAQLDRRDPVVYVIEDAHWIDEVSESLLDGFMSVVPRTPTMVLITYRPEYHGALTRIPNSQRISLAPLSEPHTSSLARELVGPDPSVDELVEHITAQAGGNPFFTEELVRDLAERGVLIGERGRYTRRTDDIDVKVPATLQATIAARIDRLSPAAKRTLTTAAVVGPRFDPAVLAGLGVEPQVSALVEADLIDQVRFTPRAEYAFRHPLIRTVAYGSQLRSERAETHRRLAAAIERGQPESVAQNAARIAEHLEAAGDLRAAFEWHMRAGAWSATRDRAAARISWQSARRVADRLPDDTPDRIAMRIAPRSMLCAGAWLSGGSVADTGFEELRELCAAADDKVSLATGMSGLVMALAVHNRVREAAQLAAEFAALLDSIDDPELSTGLLYAAVFSNLQVGQVTEGLRLADLAVTFAAGDPTRGASLTESPLTLILALRGCGRLSLGIDGWQDDGVAAVAMAAPFDPMCWVSAVMWKYLLAIPLGALPPEAALDETAEALRLAEQSGDDYTLNLARMARGLTLVHHGGSDRREGLDLLSRACEAGRAERFTLIAPVIAGPELAREQARTGDLDGAVDTIRAVVDESYRIGDQPWCGFTTAALVELLLARGTDSDRREAGAAADRLAGMVTEPGFLPKELLLLHVRAMLARADGDEKTHREIADRYHQVTTSCGFTGRTDIT